ncbi:MAG: hypothetical protein JWP82_563 [Humibacillus sp.]|nr:hypothetical protein [Humibacillus sp.]
MKQLLFQSLLIIGVLAIAWRLLISYGQKAQALRRIGLLLFAAFAVWSVLNPNLLNEIARFFGIGRGADLVFYGLVIAFLGFVVTTFKRFRTMEARYTRLARRIALDEVDPASVHRSRTQTGSPTDTLHPHPDPQHHPPPHPRQATEPGTDPSTQPEAADAD